MTSSAITVIAGSSTTTVGGGGGGGIATFENVHLPRGDRRLAGRCIGVVALPFLCPLFHAVRFFFCRVTFVDVDPSSSMKRLLTTGSVVRCGNGGGSGGCGNTGGGGPNGGGGGQSICIISPLM
jgi:hypothetical protein